MRGGGDLGPLLLFEIQYSAICGYASLISFNAYSFFITDCNEPDVTLSVTAKFRRTFLIYFQIIDPPPTHSPLPRKKDQGRL